MLNDGLAIPLRRRGDAMSEGWRRKQRLEPVMVGRDDLDEIAKPVINFVAPLPPGGKA
jgi:hypothetical protein